MATGIATKIETQNDRTMISHTSDWVGPICPICRSMLQEVLTELQPRCPPRYTEASERGIRTVAQNPCDLAGSRLTRVNLYSGVAPTPALALSELALIRTSLSSIILRLPRPLAKDVVLSTWAY